MPSTPNPLTAEQIRRNRQSRDAWDLYEPHRRQVTQLLRAAASGWEPKLCILGAGNANDVDLGRLAETYREVHLVDVDHQALAAGMAIQGLSSRPGIYLHGAIDVTGVLDHMDCWTPGQPPPDDQLDACLIAARQAVIPQLPAGMDVVASLGLMTQLVESVSLALGDTHPRFWELAKVIRDRHLRLLVQMLAQGGTALLFTEVVSSDTYPLLGTVPAGDLQATISRLVQERNFFTGANPFLLQTFFRTDPHVAPRVADTQLLGPWRWPFTARIYAVCAIRVRVEPEL